MKSRIVAKWLKMVLAFPKIQFQKCVAPSPQGSGAPAALVGRELSGAEVGELNGSKFADVPPLG